MGSRSSIDRSYHHALSVPSGAVVVGRPICVLRSIVPRKIHLMGVVNYFENVRHKFVVTGPDDIEYESKWLFIVGPAGGKLIGLHPLRVFRLC